MFKVFRNFVSTTVATAMFLTSAAAWAESAQGPAPGMDTRSAATSPLPALPSPNAGAALAADQARLTQLQNQSESVSNDAALAALAGQVEAIEARMRAAIVSESRELANIDRAVRSLQPHGHRPPSAVQTAKRETLTAKRAGIAAEITRTRLVNVAAGKAFNKIAERRREGFSIRVLQRSASPLSPDFWSGFAEAAHTDLSRFDDALDQAVDAAFSAPEPKGAIGLGTGLLAAMLLALPGRRRLEQLGRRKSGDAVSRGLARTGAALWVVMIDTGMPTIAALALRIGAEWGGLLSGDADQIAGALVVAVAWASAIGALGRVLATDSDPSQRLVAMSDDAARRIKIPLAAVAAVTGAGFILTRLNYVIGASVSATVAVDCLVSLAYGGVAGLTLISLGRSRGPTGVELEDSRSPGWALLSLFLTVAIIATLGSVFAGYSTLAALISSQIFWLGMIAAVTYLLLRFIDDLCVALFGAQAWAARSFSAMFGLKRATVSQAGLLISAGVQLIVLVAAVRVALTPFGQSGELVAAHFGRFSGDIKIGSVTVSPLAITAGFVTLAVGIAGSHAAQRWVNHRYLPLTDWDAGLRNSVSTGVGYLGVCVAVFSAMAAMGFGFQQIALIASALSVGIGFGLQQIVQNFVSGVILLIERPVKVGDWVTVDGFEGDIRRIRVRGTEIQTFDRSTVVVPNSYLITKAVQNKTLWNSSSRVHIQISIASPSEAVRARDLILDVAGKDLRVLAEPPPNVLIDSLTAGGAVNFNAFVFVANPRDVGRVRSDLYFALLEAFELNNIPFNGASEPTRMIVEPGPTLQQLLRGGALELARTTRLTPHGPAADRRTAAART